MATETHEFKPHSIPATEPPSKPPPHEITTSISPLMTEPLLPQAAETLALSQPCLTLRPPEYESWSNNRKYRWRKRYEPNQ